MIVYKIARPNNSYRWYSRHRNLDNKYILINSIKLSPGCTRLRQWDYMAPWIQFEWLFETPWRFESYEELAAVVGEAKVYKLPDVQYV